MSKDGIRHEMLRRMREAEEALERLNLIPDEDTYPDGTVLRVTVEANGREWTYVLLKHVINDTPGTARWYHTGELYGRRTSQSGPHVVWRELVNWAMSYSVRLLRWEVMRSYDDAHTLILNDDTPEGEYPITCARDGRWVIGGDRAR